jgi:formyltetrahydrofolate deformylase
VSRTWVLVASGPDRSGIVARVSGFLAERDCNVVHSQQHGDPSTGTFFMRVVLQPPDLVVDVGELSSDFHKVREELSLSARFFDLAHRPRVLVLGSREGHCLNDLLFRARTNALKADIVGVVSNHRTLEQEVGWHGIPYHHLPIIDGDKAAQEGRIWDVVQETRADLVVLARYMQILSDDLCTKLAGRCINIHHSFLPGFKGARPYHQAFARGVKLIGATAHYVTADLDEGPIIEQAVERVDHAQMPRDLAAVGRDTERSVLSRAVKWHLEHRVLLNGHRTVVFR